MGQAQFEAIIMGDEEEGNEIRMEEGCMQEHGEEEEKPVFDGEEPKEEQECGDATMEEEQARVEEEFQFQECIMGGVCKGCIACGLQARVAWLESQLKAKQEGFEKRLQKVEKLNNIAPPKTQAYLRFLAKNSLAHKVASKELARTIKRAIPVARMPKLTPRRPQTSSSKLSSKLSSKPAWKID